MLVAFALFLDQTFLLCKSFNMFFLLYWLAGLVLPVWVIILMCLRLWYLYCYLWGWRCWLAGLVLPVWVIILMCLSLWYLHWSHMMMAMTQAKTSMWHDDGAFYMEANKCCFPFAYWSKKFVFPFHTTEEMQNFEKTLFSGRRTVLFGWCKNENVLYSVSKNIFQQFDIPPSSQILCFLYINFVFPSDFDEKKCFPLHRKLISCSPNFLHPPCVYYFGSLMMQSWFEKYQ